MQFGGLLLGPRELITAFASKRQRDEEEDDEDDSNDSQVSAKIPKKHHGAMTRRRTKVSKDRNVL